jgi:hypothetical protein
LDESQRDSATKPRVARNELPWVAGRRQPNPDGVVAALDDRFQIWKIAVTGAAFVTASASGKSGSRSSLLAGR